MDLSFQIEGIERFAQATAAVKKNAERELLIALDASGRHVVDDMKRSILSGGKTGRIYKRRTVSHRASAPGEAPASDTGRLVNSITSTVVRAGLYAVISAGRGVARYAVMLEHGTRNIAPRPFFFPALERSRVWIRSRLTEAVNRALK